MLNKLEKEVDPEGKLTIRERAKRAEFARKAYYQRLAMKSAKARRRRKLICQKCGQPCEGRDCWLAGCAAPSTRLLRRDRLPNSGAVGAQYEMGQQVRRRRRSPRFGAGLR